jgi:hypothetical protein
VKPEGPTSNHSEFVVDALDKPIGKPCLEVGDNPVEVLSNGSCGPHKGLEFSIVLPMQSMSFPVSFDPGSRSFLTRPSS